jgi:hypothetical protein
MRTAIIKAPTAKKAAKTCSRLNGFYPDAVRQVDSGGKGKAWMCFESNFDANTWDKQR